MTDTPGDTVEPDKLAETGRDPVTGRFLPGSRGNPHGRPRGLDFRKVVAEEAERQGLPLEQAVWSIYRSMVDRANAGDVQAAKLVLDRLCDADIAKLHILHEGHADGPPVPPTANLLRGIRKLGILAEELLPDDGDE